MRTQALKALFLGGLIALTAAGQERKTDTKPATEKKAATLEDDIARAVQSHPDVRVAEAEAQLASAKLQQTKQAVAQKVAAAKREKDRAANELLLSKSRLEVVSRSMDLVQKHLDRMMQLQKAGNVAATELAMAERELDKARLPVLAAEQEVEASKAKLANAEAEYDALVGKTAAVAGLNKIQFLQDSVGQDRLSLVRFFVESQKEFAAPTGSFADQFRSILDKPVKMDEIKGADLASIYSLLLKAAGVKGIVRTPLYEDPKVRKDYLKITLPAGEHSLGTWLQLVNDETTDQLRIGVIRPDTSSAKRYELYIREYGLLLAPPDLAPANAPTVDEFWKRARTEKTVEPKK